MSKRKLIESIIHSIEQTKTMHDEAKEGLLSEKDQLAKSLLQFKVVRLDYISRSLQDIKDNIATIPDDQFTPSGN